MASRKHIVRSAGVYNERFFSSHHEASYRSATVVLPLVFSIFQPHSVVDIGCGTGTWLRAADQLGAHEYHGYDGSHSNQLLIPPERFTLADLSLPLAAPRRFDLAMCCEVAEHVPAASAATLVDTVAGFSNVVLFSAAIPGQGGTHHVNEQWPAYWQKLFEARGFSAYDCLRPRIWNDPQVEWWYRQNLVVYVADAAASRYSLPLKTTDVAALVHPELWEAQLKKRVVKNLVRRVKRAVAPRTKK